MMYCSSTCKHDAAQLRHSLKYKKYKKSGRERLAKALRMFRSGSSTHEIAAALGRKHTSLSCFLLQSKAYKKITDKRKKASNWYAKESSINAISVEFRLESHFNNHAMGKLKSLFPVVRREVRVPGSKRRIDIVVEHGLFRFGIELKNGNRTARLDQTLGQAIVKCNAMGGLIPVCVVPDDVTPDMVFINGCKSVGAIAGRLSDVMEEMRIRCCA